MPLVPEERVLAGRYVILRWLRRPPPVGIARARDLATGSDVVVVYGPRTALGTTARARLEHQAAVLRTPPDPRLGAVLDVLADGDVLIVPTAPVQGRTLESRLAAGPLSVLEALAVGIDLAEALSALHRAGAAHGAVAPANVVVSPSSDDASPRPNEQGAIGTCVLPAAPMAAAWWDRASPERPLAGVRYEAPERFGASGEGADERSDLYALGLVVFECLVGAPLFPGSSAEELKRHQAELPPPDLRTLVPEVPGSLEELVRRLLRRDPEDRYHTARAVAEDLEAIRAGLLRGEPDPEVALGVGEQRLRPAEPVFVGRRAELGALTERLEDARSGRGGLVLLAGESGGGKTRLLEELAHRARRQGALVVWGHGRDRVGEEPLAVLGEVAAELEGAARRDHALGKRLSGLPSHHRAAAATALPVLGELFGTPSASQLGPEDFGETRTIEALAALFDALGTPERPALVLLDDCQWAGELTARLLDRWSAAHRPSLPEGGGGPDRTEDRAPQDRPSARNAHRGGPAGSHTLVVAAYRSEEVGPDDPLARVRACAFVSLGALDAVEVERMAESMVGALPVPALEVVRRLSGGNPFMVSAVVRGLVEQGALVPAGASAGDAHDGRTPSFVLDERRLAEVGASAEAAELLAHRIRLLPETAVRLLSAGAVLGKDFDLRCALELASETPEQALAALDEARRRHIVWLRETEDRGVFVHDKLREVLLGRMSPSEVRTLHARAAAWLERHHPDSVFDLAYHLDGAGAPERAVPFALAAASQARAQFSLEVAQRYFEIAARGSERGEDLPDALRLRVAEGLGEVLMLRGRYAEAFVELRRAAQLARNRVERARIGGRLGELAFKQGDVELASRELETALAGLGRPVPRRRIGFLLRLAKEVIVQAAHTLLPRLLCGRRRVGPASEERFVEIRLLSRLAYTYWFGRGMVPCAWAHLREMNLAERYPPTPELAQAYSEHAPAASMVPWYARGLAYARRSLAIRTELGDTWGQGQSLHFAGVVLYAASRFEESLDHCERALRLLEPTGDRWEANIAALHVTYCHYRLGRRAEAAQLARELYRAALEIGDHATAGHSLGVWAKATDGAVPLELVEAEQRHLVEDVHTHVELLQAEALVHLAAGEPAAAVAALEDAQRRIRQVGLRQEYAAAAAPWLATALRAASEAIPPDDPRRRELTRRQRVAVRRALRVARRFRNNLPHALREAALFAAEHGRPHRARALLAEAMAVATAQGARAELERSLEARSALAERFGWPRAEAGGSSRTAEVAARP